MKEKFFKGYSNFGTVVVQILIATVIEITLYLMICG